MKALTKIANLNKMDHQEEDLEEVLLSRYRGGPKLIKKPRTGFASSFTNSILGINSHNKSQQSMYERLDDKYGKYSNKEIANYIASKQKPGRDNDPLSEYGSNIKDRARNINLEAKRRSKGG